MSGTENDSQVKLNSDTSDNPWIAFAEKADKDSQEPVHCPTMDQTPEAKIYNKQMINNQFSNQLSNLVMNPAPVCSPFNVWDNGPNAAQQTYTLVPTAIAQAYQQLLPLANSFQNSTPITYKPQQYNPHGTRGYSRSAKHRRNQWLNKKRNFQNQSQQNQYSHAHHNPDLRNRITVRRRSFSASSNKHEGHSKNDSGSWIGKKHRNEEDWEETSIQMNLEPLKLLTTSGSESDQWYIVVDTDVILNNFNYLNNMAAADPDCHLLIPYHVMLELQSHASDNNNVQARRIFRFLNEQIQSGLAMLGEEVAGEGRCNMAIMTCVNLASQNNSVILISNNPDVLKYKSNTKYIHVFTIKDVKDILANKSIRLNSRPCRSHSPTLALKITVPNNVVDEKLEQTDDLEPDFNQSSLTTPVSEELSNTIGSTNKSPKKSPTNTTLKQIEVNRSDDVDTRNLSRTQSSENLNDVCSQSPKNPMLNHIDFKHTDDVNTRNVSRAKRVKLQEQINTDVGDRNLLKGSVEQFQKVTSQSPPKRITVRSQSLLQPRTSQQENINNDVVDSNMLSPAAEQFKMFCSASPPKRMNYQEYGDTDVDRNMIARSANQFNMFSSQSPTKPRITHQEHENVDIEDKKMQARSLNKFGSASGQSLQNPRNTVPNKEAVDSNVEINRTHTDDNLLSSFQSPFKLINRGGYEYSRRNHDNHASLSSSSATSSHVSLDTIGMTNIVRMKRLTNINKTQTKRITSDTRSIKSTEIMQETVNRATSASRSSYDSEKSTDKKMVTPNIIVEDSSTSGVISNSESSFSEKAKSPIKKDVKKVSLRSVVMFNVGCQSMEDVLRTRCDEWVFRFVQIMEEVLRVKLQEKLPFDDKQYPAPRDLQEAARSVLKKFSDNFSVVDAANKLSFVLYKTSDEEGKIAVNIQPSDYMEMYSYGVFLVETFQDMSAHCKEKDCMKEKIIKPKENQTDSCSCYEVNTASDSLKKLLYDIQNANLESDLSADNNNPDIDQYDFGVHPLEEHEDSEEYREEEEFQHGPIQPENRHEQVANIYNLRSHKRKSQSFEEAPPKVSMSGKGFESIFFKSLQLQRTLENLNKDKGHHSNVADININRPTLHKSPDEIRQNKNFNNLQIHFGKDDFTNAKSKVVCHFTVNADFEKKVKARHFTSLHKARQIESEEFDENIEKNTDSKSAANDVNENRIEMNDESNEKFKCFMGRLARTLGDILTQVKLLCDEYVKINERTNVSMKRDMRNKMEMAYTIVGNIHGSLDSISKRDHDNDKSMQILLKVAKLQDYIPGDKLCSEYRYMINKCKEKAENFHNIIRSLLEIVRV